MTKVNLNNGNETKWDIFPGDIFKSNTISFFSKNIKMLQWISKSKFHFYDYSWTEQWKWNKIRHFFMGHTQIWDHFFIGHKIFLKSLKYFNDFYNWHLSVSLQKWAQTDKMKWNEIGHVQIWQYFSLFTTWYTI